MSTCGHSPYWVGNYGTCMVCRAEKAEAEVAALKAQLNDCADKRIGAAVKYDQLVNEVIALKATNAEVEATFNDLRRSAQVAREERDAALARAGRMEEYVKHFDGCWIYGRENNPAGRTCTCGLDKALATPANGGEAQ